MEILGRQTGKIESTACARHAVGIIAACALAAACSSGPRPKQVAQPSATAVARPVLAGASETQNLQRAVMAAADTSMQRIAAQLGLGVKSMSPEARRDDISTRLILSSALVSIAMEPDPVDALADLLTNVTLTADAQRNAAKGKPADSDEAKLLVALEQNEVDAWKLAERWVNEPTRVAFRERILAWPGARTNAASVAYVRLSDFNRGGAKSVEAGEGMFDALHAAAEQVDETRLMAERSLYLAQRLPFLLRWQAELYTATALATKEAQQTQAQMEQMTRLLDGLTAQLARERTAALDDLFGHIAEERRASLEQVQQVLQKERKATLAEASGTLAAQRQGIVKDLLGLNAAAGRTGEAVTAHVLTVGITLIVVLLAGLLATLLLYRRLAPVMDRRARAAAS
jgi:hypothetical protein